LKLRVDGAGASEKFETLSYSAFNASWEILYDAAAVADKGLIRDWAQYRMAENSDHQASVAKCKVSVALDIVSEALPLPKVRIETKPRRKVYADVKYGVGELQVVPNSGQLCVDKPTDKSKDGFRLQTETMTPDGRPVFILPSVVGAWDSGSGGSGKMKKQTVEPFWCVHRLTDELPEEERKDNMRVESVRVLGAIAMRPQNDADAQLAKQVGSFATTVPLLVNFKDRRTN